MISAVVFGLEHGSCPEAMKWRILLGPDATQADAWRLCERGDWLLWQLDQLPGEVRAEVESAVQRAMVTIMSRAIQRGWWSLRGVRSRRATEWRDWARRWLSGEDRSETAAWAAARAAWATEAVWAARAAARAARSDLEWAALRAAEAAWAAEARTTARAAAWTAELRLQASDIHREIPEWPGVES